MGNHRHIFWKPKRFAWVVGIVRKGQTYERTFSLKEHGSKTRALAAAIAWRDETYRTIDLRIVKSRHHRNQSGIIGVSLGCKTNPSGKQYWFWIGFWQRDGQCVSRKFSVLKYGNARARSLAAAARHKGISGERLDKNICRSFSAVKGLHKN